MSIPISGPRQLSVALPSPILQQNDGKALIEVYTQQQVASCEIAVQRESAMTITDSESLIIGNSLVVALADAEKAIEARAKQLKAPLKQTMEAIQEMTAVLIDPVTAAKKSLQGKLMTFKRAEDARIEAERRAAELKAHQERQAAEMERKRLQAEADAKHAAEVAAAQAKAAQDAKDLEELLGSPVEVAPVVIAPAPKIELPIVSTKVAMVAEKPIEVAVNTRKDKRVEITDLRALCRHIADGGSLDLVQANTVALKNAMGNGAQIPGAQLIEVETFVQKRAQS